MFLRRTRHFASIVSLFVLVASSVLAQSQPRQPERSPGSAQQPPAADPRGTNTSPFVVQIQPATKTDEETAKEQAQIEDQQSAQRWTKGLGIATGVLGLLQLIAIGFQVGIARRQNKIIERQNAIMTGQRDAADKQSDYMRDGLIETRKAADAAKESAAIALAALHNTERAQVSVPYTDWQVIEPEDKCFGDYSFSISYSITNSGRTHAVITHIAFFGTRTDPGPDEGPPPINFATERPEWEGQAIIAAGQSIPRTWNCSIISTEQELLDLWAGKTVYWIQGRVSYNDIFGKPHFTNFTTRLYLPTKTFSFRLQKGYSDGD